MRIEHALQPVKSCLIPIGLAFLITLSCASVLSAVPPNVRKTKEPKKTAKQIEIEGEMKYIARLREKGLPSYAKIALDRLNAKYPGEKDTFQTEYVASLAMKGKFDEAWRMVNARPDKTSPQTWALKLRIADYMAAWNQYDKMRDIYERFFRQYPTGPPKEISKLFIESAYRYAKTLEMMCEGPAALKAYDFIIKTKIQDKDGKNAQRTIKGDAAELCVRLGERAGPGAQRGFYFQKARDIIGSFRLNMDMVMGKGIVLNAHMLMLDGKLKEASAKIESTRSVLENLHGAIKAQAPDLLRVSPLVQCRYLMGEILKRQGDALLVTGKKAEAIEKYGCALTELINVFGKYPESSWAPDAGKRAEEIIDILEQKLGKTVRYDKSRIDWSSIVKHQFKNARATFLRNDYVTASREYQEVLFKFPETESSIGALGELVQCYLEMEDERYVWYDEVVINYISERFGSIPSLNEKAGNVVLKIALNYEKVGKPEERDRTYNTFFDQFKNHPRAAGLYYRFGEKKFFQKMPDVAIGYYQRLVTNYPSAASYEASLGRIADCYMAMERYTNAMTALDVYASKLKPSPQLASARYRTANCHRRLKDIRKAWKMYDEIAKKLLAKGSPYSKNQKELEQNKSITEGAIFYRALCYSKLETDDDGKKKKYMESAIHGYKQLLKMNDESDFAPAAFAQIGTLYTVLDNPEEAQKALSELQKKYPGSVEAQNAKFILAINLFEIGRKTAAIKLFKEMFSKGGDYSAQKLLTAGLKLQKVGEHEIAMEALQKAAEKGKGSRAIREAALLGVAMSSQELGKPEEVVKALEALLENSSRTARMIDVCYMLGKAKAVVAQEEPDKIKRRDAFIAAMDKMKMANKYAKERPGQKKKPGEKAKVAIGLGVIYEQKAMAERKFGNQEDAEKAIKNAAAAYQRLALLGNVNDPKVRPFIEQALVNSAPILIDLKMWQDLMDNAQTYTKQFPAGKNLSKARKWRSKALLNGAKATEEMQEEGEEAPAEPVAEEKKSEPPAAVVEEEKPEAPAEKAKAPAKEPEKKEEPVAKSVPVKTAPAGE